MDAAPLLSLKLVAAILMTRKVSLILGASNYSGLGSIELFWHCLYGAPAPTGNFHSPEFFSGGSMFNLLQMC